MNATTCKTKARGGALRLVHCRFHERATMGFFFGLLGTGGFLMAGDWIKIENVTPDKPEVYKMAEFLEIDPDAVLGKLIRVWVWADQQTYSGNAGSVTLALLDRVSGVANFGKALESAGWLERENDILTFPNFERHNGQTAKRRALTSKRVKEHRGKKVKRKCNAPSVTSSSLLYSSFLSSLREEMKDPEFERAWNEWVDYRQEIKHPITETMAKKQIKKMGEMGKDRAIAMIDHTISQGWQGLREPDQTQNGKSQAKRKWTRISDGPA